MKTIVLMGISCLMLAGVYGVMIKKSEVSNLLSFNKDYNNNTVPSFGSDNPDKAAPAFNGTENKKSASKTLDDSHWIDDPLFEKAAGSELIIDSEGEVADAGPKTNPETIKRAAPEQDKKEITNQLTPEVKQLILELNPDTLAEKKKVPVEVI
ncbi:hypothetical protein [Niastella populi]|uniref:Uncharacterized protein n=1 Tax=Niastella populi TaxID=550983 RepID=A0A1V9FTD2_9BACT|nr:hypothetical protein [Niastella populi]OQP61615.1 hypothetical protein A4R26_18795 [Niastella populi]